MTSRPNVQVPAATKGAAERPKDMDADPENLYHQGRQGVCTWSRLSTTVGRVAPDAATTVLNAPNRILGISKRLSKGECRLGRKNRSNSGGATPLLTQIFLLNSLSYNVVASFVELAVSDSGCTSHILSDTYPFK